MAELESLLNDLANLDAQHDLDGLRRVRERIVEEYPDSDAAVEALYKLGLDLLFRSRDIEQAVVKFVEAAKRKHVFWSAAARTSLGLCYYHQKRNQKALLELRKVAYAEPPTSHSITALGFIEQIFSNEGNLQEIERVRKDRISQLRRILKAGKEAGITAAERGFHLYNLGLALKDAGEEEEAVQSLQTAKALGPDALGADLYRSVVEAL